MTTKHSRIMIAGGLLFATALCGAIARGAATRAGQGPSAAVPTGKTIFAAPAAGSVSFTGHLDRTAVLLGHGGVARMELVLAAAPDEEAQKLRRPTDVVIVLDRSGSMGGEKMEHARAAVRELMAQLGPQDRLALVTYSDGASVAIPLAAVTDAARSEWGQTVAGIQPGGGTNMSSGLDLGTETVEAARVSGRVPHVILISDGLANQGDASPAGLTRRAARAAQGEYMLSTVGVGTDFNESLMSALADAGTGNYYYVRNSASLADVFAREFDAARSTVASGLAVQIEPGQGVRVVDAAGYPLEQTVHGVVFRPGSLFAGQERRIWVTLDVPHDATGDYDVGRFVLSYDDGFNRATMSFSEVPRITCVRGEDQFYSSVDVATWSRSVIVDAYNEMQEDVAQEVRAGRRAAALQRVQQFRDETVSMNARLKEPAVAMQLDATAQLEHQVSGAFNGPDQVAQQNELSKAASAAAVDARRAGSKK